MEFETHYTPLEVKFKAGDEPMTFSGYGSVFGNMDSHGDVIVKGAFNKTLAEAKSGEGDWPAMLMQHGGFLGGGDSVPIGSWTELKEDEYGLYVEGKLADTARGREAYELLKLSPRPAITGMSIGYRALEWTTRAKPDDPRRTLKAVKLYEVSLVTMPSNGRARVQSVKSDEIKTIRDFENFLRDAGGFSRTAAKAIAAGGFKDADHRDDAVTDELAELIRRNSANIKR